MERFGKCKINEYLKCILNVKCILKCILNVRVYIFENNILFQICKWRSYVIGCS